MSDVLDKILAYKRHEIEAGKERVPFDDMEMAAFAQVRPRGFLAAIRQRLAEGRTALIAEIKKASPSKGLIRPDFDPPALAAAYEVGGATCLSVLTDAPSFQGSPEYLVAARAACSLPVLRKDFMLDPYQVFEARAMGADCILVILAAVDDDTAQALIGTAEAVAMDVLVEVHDEAELARAVALEADLIGVNNRDLRTFRTDLGTSERLAALMPPGRIIVAESGISRAADIAQLGVAGVRTFLVGESLMLEDDVAQATRRLLAPVRSGLAGVA